jgi:hypothetical protein
MTHQRMNAMLFGTVACTLVVPLAARAQQSRPVEFGIMGGAAFPISRLTEAATSGWNAGALVSFGAAASRMRVRIDAQWMQLPGKQPGQLFACEDRRVDPPICAPPVQFDFRALDATANVVYTLPSGIAAKLYVIGGAGVYGERATSTSDRSRTMSTKLGLNGGLGVKFRTRTLGGFLEARYHNIIHGSDTSGESGSSFDAKSLQLILLSAGITY